MVLNIKTIAVRQTVHGVERLRAYVRAADAAVAQAVVIERLVDADDLVAAPEQAVCDEIILMQAAFGVMQQFPDLGAVHLVPRDGVDRAVGGVKLVQQVLAAENTLLRGACEVGRVAALAVLLHVLDRAEGHIGVMLLAGVVQRLQKARQNDIIGVNKGIIAALGGVDAGVARGGQALVLLMDDPHALITGGVLVADLSAAVGGAVVDEKHLDGHIDLLGQNALDALGQVGLRVVNRHDYTDRDMFHNLFPLPRMQASPGSRRAVGQRWAGAERGSPQLLAQRQVFACQYVGQNGIQMLFVCHKLWSDLGQVARRIGLAPELVKDLPVPHNGPVVVLLAPGTGREVLQPLPVHPQVVGLARRKARRCDLPGAGAVMVKHIGQAVAALTLKYTVQHAGIVAEKHRLIVMNALFLKQPRVEQLVPA